MSSKEITDAEAHELVIARQSSLTREEWQARLDQVAKRFGHGEPAVSMAARNGFRKKPTNSSHKVAKEVAKEVAKSVLVAS